MEETGDRDIPMDSEKHGCSLIRNGAPIDKKMLSTDEKGINFGRRDFHNQQVEERELNVVAPDIYSCVLVGRMHREVLIRSRLNFGFRITLTPTPGLPTWHDPNYYLVSLVKKRTFCLLIDHFFQN
ncbi:hypothetical protein TNCT_371511 [Trichonephila clavata]|uniref:Uncharacterized protein n=1 Tax=Trichonephila clavata TaxID=2740835 RepID=A0A8X6KIT3_TRICU|nr:hypothetical protein TNCT_371511 [Trichonephila clavata]